VSFNYYTICIKDVNRQSEKYIGKNLNEYLTAQYICSNQLKHETSRLRNQDKNEQGDESESNALKVIEKYNEKSLPEEESTKEVDFFCKETEPFIKSSNEKRSSKNKKRKEIIS